MTLLEIISNVLYEETLPIDRKTGKRKTGILLLDVDDTLLQARDIYIWRKKPEDKSEVRLTPQEYADEKVAPGEKKYYSYREFRDAEKVKNSIIKGLPYVNNLKIMDKFINGGYVIGILTARGMEDVVYQALSEFLKYRGPDGNLRPIKLNRKLVFAVNDDFKVYTGRTDYEKKKNVIRKIKDHFDYVYFLDDDIKNIKEVKSLKKELSPEDARKIRTIKAEPPKKKLNESYLIEMAVEDLRNKDFTDLIEQGKLKEAGYKYIDLVVQNTPKSKGTNRYSGKSWLEIAHSVSGQGLARSINTALKKGLIDKDFADKVRKAVDLAVKNPPQEVMAKHKTDKAEEEKIRDEFKQVEKDKEEEKITGGELPERDNFVIKVRKEIKRVEKIKSLFLDEFLDADYFSLSEDALDKFEEDLNWVKKSLIPAFVKEPEMNTKRLSKLREIARGVSAREDALKTSWKLDNYIKSLKEVTDTVEYINKFSGLKTKEEKIDELKNNVGFEVLFKKMNGHFSNLSPKDASKEIRFSSKTVTDKAKSRDLLGADTQKLVKTYFKKLKEVEEAFSDGTLRDFVRSNIEDIRTMVMDASEGVRYGQAKDYKHPEGFDNKDISEAEDFGEEIPEIYKGRDFGPKVGSILKERSGKDYAYAGITRDRPEIKYLTNYAETGRGTEEKIFKILVNIYMDFIDGVSILVSSKNKGEGGKGLERAKIIEKGKKLKKREEELKSIKVEHYGPKEVRDLLLIRIQKIDKSIREKAKIAFSSIDFTALSDEELNVYISLAKDFMLNDEKFVKELMNKSGALKSISKEDAKEMIDKELSKLTSAERFKYRVAVSVNYNGDKFSDSQIIELAKSILDDKTGEEFKKKLGSEEYSTRIDK